MAKGTKINGKLTKRETVRRIYDRAVQHLVVGDGKNTYSMAYLSRRIGLSTESTKYFLNWMNRNEGIKFVSNRGSVTFTI